MSSPPHWEKSGIQSSSPTVSKTLIPCVNFWFIARIPVNKTVLISTLSFTLIPSCWSSKFMFSNIPRYSSVIRIVKTLRNLKTLFCKYKQKNSASSIHAPAWRSWPRCQPAPPSPITAKSSMLTRFASEIGRHIDSTTASILTSEGVFYHRHR